MMHKQLIYEYEPKYNWWTLKDEVAHLLSQGLKIAILTPIPDNKYIIVVEETENYPTPFREWNEYIKNKYRDKKAIENAQMGYKDTKGNLDTEDYVKIGSGEASKIIETINAKYNGGTVHLASLFGSNGPVE